MTIPNDLKGAGKEWEWFGNAAHFICGQWCRFHLATKVGGYLVSTVGEYWPERSSREITAGVHDPVWLRANSHRRGDDFDNAYMKRFGYGTIGYDRKYETMVFTAGDPCECGCGLPSIASSELDFAGYNDASAATRGHMELCRKYANLPNETEPNDAALASLALSPNLPSEKDGEK